jgi:transcriptional regulator with XRE-family HTH domain
MVEVADAAGLSAETLRKVERGRAPTPSLFTIAAVSQVLGLSLDDVVRNATAPQESADPGAAYR